MVASAYQSGRACSLGEIKSALSSVEDSSSRVCYITRPLTICTLSSTRPHPLHLGPRAPAHARAARRRLGRSNHRHQRLTAARSCRVHPYHPSLLHGDSHRCVGRQLLALAAETTGELTCSATAAGLSLRVRLLRSLPERFKVDIKVKEGTHQSENAGA